MKIAFEGVLLQRDLTGRLLDHGGLDWLVVAIATTLAWRPLRFTDQLSKVPQDHLRAAYGASASSLAILAGFTVSVTFYFASSDSPTLEQFRNQFGRRLNRTLIGAFVALVLATFALIGAILAAPKTASAFLFVLAIVIGIVKLTRVSWLAYAMLTARYRDSRQAPVEIQAPGGEPNADSL